MKTARVEDRAFRFAKGIIAFVVSLSKSEIRFVLGKQLLRSGTAIGANIEEARGGISRKDFIHCMNIAKKEARETFYWLKLIYESGEANKEGVHPLLVECQELLNILTAIVKTAQQNNK